MNELDWGSLGFRYRKTNAIVFSLYRDGQWSERTRSLFRMA